MAHEEKAAPKTEPQVTLPASALAELIASQVRSEVARIMSSKTPDERMSEAMAEQRGLNRPPIPESFVACRSPITGATFRVRLAMSKTFPSGRVVEIVDYVRPPGWDQSKGQGGLYEGDAETMTDEKGNPSKKYVGWVYKSFWQKDWNELSGKPASFLTQWRSPEAA